MTDEELAALVKELGKIIHTRLGDNGWHYILLIGKRGHNSVYLSDVEREDAATVLEQVLETLRGKAST